MPVTAVQFCVPLEATHLYCPAWYLVIVVIFRYPSPVGCLVPLGSCQAIVKFPSPSLRHCIDTELFSSVVRLGGNTVTTEEPLQKQKSFINDIYIQEFRCFCKYFTQRIFFFGRDYFLLHPLQTGDT